MNGRLQRFLRLRMFGSVVVSLLTVAPLGASPAPSVDDGIDWHKERQFWSFQPPAKHAPPAVTRTEWPGQPIDYFILARLEKAGLAPAPEAEKRHLIRRLSFTLTGLPPTPEEVEAFCQDTSAGAYERLVERLLASPFFGERLASLWLPLARFAEDQAFQVGSDTKFFYPNAYKYRQWVIDAFNRDLPYPEFIRLQLAADKFEGTNSVNLAALGFLGLGPKYYNRGRLDVMADEWEDGVDTVTRTFLGLTVSCSRCHDHKFDPVTTEDYYALAGVFASTRMVNLRASGTLEDEKAQADKMHTDTVHIVQDGTVQDLNVFIRGNVKRKGPVAKRRFLQILAEDEPAPFTDGSGRRELAEAISDPDNPLTARVMVNRVWGLVFGKPLVRTASNFGHAGEKPTHPELLDWLARRFVEQGGSVKTLVRELVLSSTYRQCSQAAPDIARTDPENNLLSHMNRQRLTIEQWRDAVLMVSGDLEFEGGKSLELDDLDNRRRTVHGRVSRLKLNDMLMQFDYPDANVHAEKRSQSTTATQKLFMLNSPFMLAQAKAFAQRARTTSSESLEDQVRRMYQLVYARAASPEEMQLAREFCSRPEPCEMPRLEQFAQVLLMSNEMLYVD